MNIYGNPIASGNVSSSSLISVNNDVALYDGVSGNIIKDSGVTIGSISGGPFVALNGSTPMTGDLNLNTNDITNVTTLNSKTVNDLVTSSSGSSIDGNIAVFDSTSGKIIKDSGLGSNIILNLAAAESSLANQVQGVSPAGARDLWQTIGGGFAGAVLNYYEDINTMYSTDYGGPGFLTRRSLDGGLTWLPLVYDIAPPSTSNIIVGCNDARTLWVGITQWVAGGDKYYTSVDGLNFVAGPNTAPSAIYTDNIIFDSVSGLFIAGMLIDPTHSIITSPDGITWTPRVSPDYSAQINYMQLAKKNDNSVIVVVGDARVQPSYSLDHGLTWLSGSGSAASAQAICWSEDKQEFIAGGVTTNLSTSVDGIVWQDRGANGPFACTSFKWVPFPISRYYAARSNQATGHYSLYSTPDSYLPFLQPEDLEGSTVLNQAYSAIVYIPQYDRFVLGVDTDGIAYSTARPLIIKPMVTRNASENLNMGGFEIQNVSAIRNSGSSVIYGNGASTVDIQSVAIGNNALIDSGSASSTIIGSSSYATGGGAAVSVGTSASCLQLYGVAIGNGAIAGGTRSIALGFQAGAMAANSMTLGWNITNSIANSILFGNAAVTIGSIRPNTTGQCSLGLLSTNEFSTCFANNLDTSAALAIAPTSATSVAIGRSTINTNILGKGYVNSTRPIMSGGFSMITNTTVQNTLTETTIIGSGVGSLTGVANTASAGNTSHMTASGILNITGTPSITIRVYGGPTSTTLLASFPIALSSLVVNVPWKLNTDFVIKSIGAAGVASIQLNSTFQVADVSPNSFGNQTLNNTTFDTTVNNVINITVQWSAANASNIFTTNQLFSHSVYVV